MPPFNAFAIPSELRALNQWCLWKYEDIGTPKPTKVPYQPNGFKTSVTDKSTWASFNDCFNSYNFGGYDGLGFIFSDSDPYAFIDLDSVKYLKDGVTPNPNYQIDLDRQLKIFHEFDSYSEISPSGEGLHIIVKGSLPSGKRRDFVELYSSARYATMTGNVYAEKPIADRNDLLLQLYHQMGDEVKIIAASSQPQFLSDDQVITHALGAVNGEKFLKLHTGRWQELYSSQSEADYAYIDIIAFYSKNTEQIVRLFRASPLGQRDKAKRKDYVLGMVNQSFDKMLPNIDFDGFKNALDVKLAKRNQQLDLPNIPSANQSSIPLPPGLIGEIAQFIFEAAPRPVEEIALAGAIALMSGICGRSYNISSTGLNQYVLMVAGTGCHAKGTEILMYDGSVKNVEDININDLIMGPDSLPRKVLNLARGIEPMVKIIPTKGDSFVVNQNHILSLVHTQHKDRVNLTVVDYLSRSNKFKHCYKLERKAVDFQDKSLPLDPWFLGAMLGDGQLGPKIQLTSQDNCIRERAKDIVEHLGLEIRTSQVEGNKSFQDTYVRSSPKVKNELKLIFEDLGLYDVPCEHKFIPEIYKTSHYEDRLAILAGLLDTDGSLTNNCYDYISKSKRLAKDVCFVARSIGAAAYMSECEKYSQLGTGGIYYRVSISGDLSNLPMSLEYKKSKPRLQKKNVLVSGFKVELLPEDNFYGFALDKDHLYLTADFTVHHNTGKEAAAAGISKLINAVKMQVPTASEFIGPSEISSGPALFKYLGTQSRSFVSILGEFGLRIKQLSAENANGADISLRRMLLDLFNKSGFNDVAYKSIYSDKDKNTTDIFSPALSIFGESTPERLYTALNEEMISEGLLPRFHIIEYRGNRRDLNEHHASIQPPFQLVEKLGAICAHSMTMNYSMPRKVVNVETNDAAYKLLQDFDRLATDKINNGDKNVVKELWNRAHVKALKLSALIAVGVNYVAPVITEDHVNWSITLITNDINNLTARFEAGEIGQAQAAESKQVTEVKKTIREYIHADWSVASKYSDNQALHIARIVPYAYISRRLIASAAFRHDRMGATNAIKRTLSIMMDSGQILEVGRAELGSKYGTTQRAFVVKDVTIIE